MPADSAPPSRRVLLPRRKRKFFADLAQLLGEDAPAVRPLQGAFFGPELPEGGAPSRCVAVASPDAAATQFVPSHSLTSDSFESVEFGAPRTRSSGIGSFGASQQSSHNDSMADSMLFLPVATSGSLRSTGDSQKRQKQHVRFEFEIEANRSRVSRGGNEVPAPSPATTLINSGMEKPPTSARLELTDYYDADRMCELSPCWLRSNGASCEMHQGAIRRPMLLFCLQALDEFIARNEWQGQQCWRVQACKLARRVFTGMWEADVLGNATSERDIVVAEGVGKKAPVVGVALDVWRILARYWDKYKQNYLHQQELYFADAPQGTSALAASKWDQVRALLHIYGMKPSHALRLVEQQGGGQLDVRKLTDRQLHAAAYGQSSVEHLRVGVEYLASCVHDEGLVRRPMISQQDGKTAFQAILIHLTKWNQDVQVFPCGSFSRGAAFISVLDVLVAVHTGDGASTSPDDAFQGVVAALTAAKVIQEGAMHQISRTRGACIIPFKSSSILLDLKVYSPPRSWLALLYFTGPEDFVLAFFTDLLKRSLREIPDTSFECIYSSAVEAVGRERLAAIATEKDLFDLIGRDYVQPTDRI